jgi:3-methyladenine DNA glycosylase Tag
MRGKEVFGLRNKHWQLMYLTFLVRQWSGEEKNWYKMHANTRGIFNKISIWIFHVGIKVSVLKVLWRQEFKTFYHFQIDIIALFH